MEKVKIFLLLSSFFLIVFTAFSLYKTPITCAATYGNGDCANLSAEGGSSNNICYTGTQGPDNLPGYACGDPTKDGTSGYVYVKDTLGVGGSRFHGGVLQCNNGGGQCCAPGTPLPSLPPHQGYDLGGTYCSATSICYTGGDLPDPVLSGEQCGNLTGWHFGSNGDSNNAPRCLTGFCCDAGSANTTPPPPNPCPSENGVCTKIDTAVGVIDVSGPGGVIKSIFGLLLSISGGTALILIIFSGYRIMAAQGDPEKVKGAREMLTSAIIGLLFIIFSVTILQILGVDILHIPGFSK